MKQQEARDFFSHYSFIFLFFVTAAAVLFQAPNAFSRFTPDPVVSNNNMLKTRLKPALKTLSLPFIKNEGQINRKVAFYAKTFGGTVFVTKDGRIVYSLPARKGGVAIRESFINARVKEIKGKEKTTAHVNYFIGKDRSNWFTNIPTYSYITLGSVYKGVEVRLKAYGSRVEKLFYIKPYTDIGKIHLKIEGAEKLEIAKDGGLKLITEKGDVYFTKPLAYQKINGKKRFIEASYTLIKNNEYGFKLGSYDKTKPVVIDPLLASTYLGGSNVDPAIAIALDSSGNVYVTGYTESTDFPTTSGVYDSSFNRGSSDAFISKLSPNLTTLLASTYLGGSGFDLSYAIALDKDGNVYVAGGTDSNDFPTTTGCYDNSSNGDYDAFISKLSPDLTTLLASTYLGWSYFDEAYAIALDKNGNVYVAGETDSDDFPTTSGAYDRGYSGYEDAFVSKFDPDLTTLAASTYLGGSDDEAVRAIAFDKDGNVYVAGWTESDNFPAKGFDNSSNGGWDAFISKLDPSLSNLLASTYLGGDERDQAYAVTLDKSGNVYVAGYTQSDDFPTTSGAYDSSFNGYGAFISKLDPNLTTLAASTYLGGGYSWASAIALDKDGNVYVAGGTGSDNFPVTEGAYDNSFDGGSDAFISKLDPNLSTLLASTYLGGSGGDLANAIAIDKNGNVYVAGGTGSDNFPVTEGAYDNSFDGGSDAFISKLDPDLSASSSIVVNDPTNNSTVTVSSGTGTMKSCSILTPEQAENNSTIDTSSMPDDISSLSKVIETEIDNVTQGGSTTVTISNLTVPDNPLFYKYVNGNWINLSNDTACGNCGFSYKKNTNGTYTISFTITDGGTLDFDGLPNGIIKDPVVIGSSTTTSTPSSSSGGGCTTSDSASMGLILILLAGVGLGVRRKT